MMLYVISSTSCYCSKAAPSTLTPRNLLPTISSQLNVIANYSAGHIIHLLQVTNMITSGSQLINVESQRCSPWEALTKCSDLTAQESHAKRLQSGLSALRSRQR